MALFKLLRLSDREEIVTEDRKPTRAFQRWWQKIVDALGGIADAETTEFGLSLLAVSDAAELKALLGIVAADVSDFDAAADARITLQKGAALGLAPLDSGGKVSSAHLPAIAMTDVFSVASEAAQLALTAEEGDVAIRSDLSKSYVHNGGTAGTMADWSELLNPTTGVTSFNGRTGAVTLTDTDQITALGYTPANVGGHLGQFAATTSAQLLAVISDPTGTGSLVFASSPTFVTPTLGTASATRLLLGSGSAGSPALSFTGANTTGLFRAGTEVHIAAGGTDILAVFGSGASMASDKKLYFDGGSNTYITQSAAGGAGTLDIVANATLGTRYSNARVRHDLPVFVANAGGVGGLTGYAGLYAAGGGLYTTGGSGTVTSLAPA